MKKIADITGLLLAAGSASRFGGDKLLAPLADGTPVAVRAARNLMAALPHAVAVVRGPGTLADRLAACGLRVVTCPEAAGGMGRSLACAVAASRDAGGWVVALADMPFIAPRTIERVAAAIAAGTPIAAPTRGGARGHPVGFGPSLLDALLHMSGDTGARSLLAGGFTAVAVDDGGIFEDIDTRADLSRLA